MFIIVAFFLISSCHVGRFFVYNFANIKDYKKFPKREIEKAQQPFQFIEKIDSARISKIITYSNKYSSLNHFEKTLEENKTVAFMVFKSDTLIYEWYVNNYTE